MACSVLDFLDVTELAGDPISAEQLDRMVHRYDWAAGFCREKDVAEVACGTGPGLGLLALVARSLEAGDFSAPMLDRVRVHYGDRVPLQRFDASKMPYADVSKDVLIIFEAIYYLSSTEDFVEECRRVLRPRGHLLIVTANKDLSDFNPSPHSYTYYGVMELESVLRSKGFSAEYFGYISVSEISLKQRILRPVKQMAVKLGLMPKTMVGKKLLKKLMFGDLVKMPAEITEQHLQSYVPPKKLEIARNTTHKVIYCAATKQD